MSKASRSQSFPRSIKPIPSNKHGGFFSKLKRRLRLGSKGRYSLGEAFDSPVKHGQSGYQSPRGTRSLFVEDYPSEMGHTIACSIDKTKTEDSLQNFQTRQTNFVKKSTKKNGIFFSGVGNRSSSGNQEATYSEDDVFYKNMQTKAFNGEHVDNSFVLHEEKAIDLDEDVFTVTKPKPLHADEFTVPDILEDPGYETLENIRKQIDDMDRKMADVISVECPSNKGSKISDQMSKSSLDSGLGSPDQGSQSPNLDADLNSSNSVNKTPRMASSFHGDERGVEVKIFQCDDEDIYANHLVKIRKKSVKKSQSAPVDVGIPNNMASATLTLPTPQGHDLFDSSAHQVSCDLETQCRSLDSKNNISQVEYCPENKQSLDLETKKCGSNNMSAHGCINEDVSRSHEFDLVSEVENPVDVDSSGSETQLCIKSATKVVLPSVSFIEDKLNRCENLLNENHQSVLCERLADQCSKKECAIHSSNHERTPNNSKEEPNFRADFSSRNPADKCLVKIQHGSVQLVNEDRIPLPPSSDSDVSKSVYKQDTGVHVMDGPQGQEACDEDYANPSSASLMGDEKSTTTTDTENPNTLNLDSVAENSLIQTDIKNDKQSIPCEITIECSTVTGNQTQKDCSNLTCSENGDSSSLQATESLSTSGLVKDDRVKACDGSATSNDGDAACFSSSLQKDIASNADLVRPHAVLPLQCDKVHAVFTSPAEGPNEGSVFTDNDSRDPSFYFPDDEPIHMSLGEVLSGDHGPCMTIVESRSEASLSASGLFKDDRVKACDGSATSNDEDAASFSSSLQKDFASNVDLVRPHAVLPLQCDKVHAVFASPAEGQNEGNMFTDNDSRDPSFYFRDDEPIHMSLEEVLSGDHGPCMTIVESRSEAKKKSVDNIDQEAVQAFKQSMKELKECGWYWGPLSSNDAEVKLSNKPDGAFLVRDSASEHYILSLSFKSGGEVLHTRIEHFKGKFGFWSQPESHGKTTIKDFIEQAMENSRNGQFKYFLRAQGPGLPPVSMYLLYPVSRFKTMRSLMHMCRFQILQIVRRDHVELLPLPQKIRNYLKERQYYVEIIDDEANDLIGFDVNADSETTAL